MDKSITKYSGYNAEKIGELTDQQKVHAVFPSARYVFKIHPRTGSKIHRILAEDMILGASFASEEYAWKWAWSIINKKMMDKLSQ